MTAQKAIALQLRKLASDPASQQFICQEPTCMQGLITLLSTSPTTDPDTLIIALQALAFLASHPSNRAPLTQQSGLIVRLVAVREEGNAVMRDIVVIILDHLQSTVNKDTVNDAPSHKQARRSSVGPSQPRRGRHLHTLNLVVQRAGEAASLSLEERGRLEKQLIVVKGVISVSVNRAGGIGVYSKRDEAEMVDSLHTAVKAVDATFSISMQSSSTTAVHNKENVTPPPAAVTPASSSASLPLKLASASSSSSSSSSSLSSSPFIPVAASSSSSSSRALVAHSTFEQNSLQNRFQAKQKKAVEADVKQGVVKGLFSSVSSFFW